MMFWFQSLFIVNNDQRLKPNANIFIGIRIFLKYTFLPVKQKVGHNDFDTFHLYEFCCEMNVISTPCNDSRNHHTRRKIICYNIKSRKKHTLST